ncbi:hypothetical protein K458DRAFT_70936 [Lentithecium fluviatile CBS 122367]|uniref:Uncharacterized protein n=1 Tax=Lentithecium fluviatile CBS 122367 TaxID=1168545 RepID=A0A6G1JLA8_9PLEO|nr:hypothetical protein K458DRAFT_70936 [Lentithecium fluviatile CBS 122367]
MRNMRREYEVMLASMAEGRGLVGQCEAGRRSEWRGYGRLAGDGIEPVGARCESRSLCGPAMFLGVAHVLVGLQVSCGRCGSW